MTRRTSKLIRLDRWAPKRDVLLLTALSLLSGFVAMLVAARLG